MCIKVYELDPAHFLTSRGLAWQACLKKTGVELELFTDANMLLMVEEGIRGEGDMQYIDMQQQIISIWKIMIRIKSLHFYNI